ncbi:MAG: XdhC family protein [Clostridia bacterium]|nr:XdhC family protein [Clostridia bacterium]
MNKLWEQMVNLLSSGKSFVVATLFDKSGSAPRVSGAKMIIKSDGSIAGTIGGGRLEGEIRELAKDIFETKRPQIRLISLTGADAAQMEMICGGTVKVLVDYIEALDPVNLEICRDIVDVINNRGKAWLITALGTEGHNKDKIQRCLVKENDALIGQLDCDQEFLKKLISGPAKISIHSETLEDQRIFVEPIQITKTLYIFGAGHVAQQIAPLAEKVGFKTVVLDDRQEYANKERFPGSEIILLESLADPLPQLDIDEDSYLCIVTRGHLHDKRVLEQVLRTPAAYIGMIGSTRKRDKVYEKLEEQGFTKEELRRVHSPIGLEILAETPEEIAVSIVAELIKVRAEKEKCQKKN